MASIVGYCPVCGGPIIKPNACHTQKKYCTNACKSRAIYRRLHGQPISDAEYYGRPQPARRKTPDEQHAEMLARLAQRDAEYAAHSASKVEVVVRDGMIFETRGRHCIASRCGEIRQQPLATAELPNMFEWSDGDTANYKKRHQK